VVPTPGDRAGLPGALADPALTESAGTLSDRRHRVHPPTSDPHARDQARKRIRWPAARPRGPASPLRCSGDGMSEARSRLRGRVELAGPVATAAFHALLTLPEYSPIRGKAEPAGIPDPFRDRLAAPGRAQSTLRGRGRRDRRRAAHDRPALGVAIACDELFANLLGREGRAMRTLLGGRERASRSVAKDRLPTDRETSR
jgi:hypothetical protein